MTKFLKNNRLAAPALALLLSLLAQTCIEMDKTVGEDFIPDNQQLQIQTLNATGFFTMETVELDSMPTSSFGTAMLGRMDDSRLGKTSAGFVVQLQPATTSYPFEDSVTKFDSVVLILGFSSTYKGDKMPEEPMNVEVYELKTDLSIDTTYYGTPSVAESVSNMAINLAASGSISAASATARVKLTDSGNLFDRLFNHTTDADTFLTYFKGMYVKVDDGAGGSIKSVSMVNTSSEYASSALVAYYHYAHTDDDGVTTKDSVKSFTFHAFNTTPRFNVFWHGNDHLRSDTSTNTNTTLYMQGLAGVATRMAINKDSLEAWTGVGDKKRHYAISRAELVLHVSDENNYTALDKYSTQLQCIVEASSRTNGKYAAIRDMYASDGSFSSSFDGALNRSLMQYSLNITHYFNSVQKGATQPLLMVPYGYTSDASSVLIDNTINKPQLKITYVEIKE
ncbi:MAG: DUF4270 domain-containing protein [Prevotellaceae bacterium]|jgi:hypothetical protein|nr:DUF4270 domain-containing protein [Prevotellaceae bacterium]